MDKPLRAYLVEMIGTFVFVLLGAVALCTEQSLFASQPSILRALFVALSLGCVYAVLVTATTRTSEACLNPAITLMLWVTQRYNGARTTLVIFVQLIGAGLAGGLVVLIFPQDVLTKSLAGTPHLQEAMTGAAKKISLTTLAAGIAVEAVLTFLLSMAVLFAVLDPKRAPYGGLLMGCAMTGCVLLGHFLTQAALNPARWLGPALWQSTVATLRTKATLQDHVVYWMGPIVGSLLAGVFYVSLIAPSKRSANQAKA